MRKQYFQNTPGIYAIIKSPYFILLLNNKPKAREQWSYKSVWIILPEVSPPGTPDTLSCRKLNLHKDWRLLTAFWGIDYLIPQAVKNNIQMSFRWTISTWIKRHTQVTGCDSQTLYFNNITANPQNFLDWMSTSVVCGSYSDIPSRLVDYLQFSSFTDERVMQPATAKGKS